MPTEKKNINAQAKTEKKYHTLENQKVVKRFTSDKFEQNTAVIQLSKTSKWPMYKWVNALHDEGLHDYLQNKKNSNFEISR